MAKKIIQLGIDYGTSASKIVFRDYMAPGQETAYVVLRGGSPRIPSSVALENGMLIFGEDPATFENRARSIRWFHSLKMRAAGETKNDYPSYFFGELTPIPEGFTAKDLAVLSVWHLISEAISAVKAHFHPNTPELMFRMTMGTPINFWMDQDLKAQFLEIARTAWQIYLSEGVLASKEVPLQSAMRVLRDAYHEVRRIGELPQEDVKLWLRSEAEAGLWWAIQSPAVSEGRYAEVDIGAGTTNSSVFRLLTKFQNGSWVKTGIAFFGAFSVPFGMDSVDAGFSNWAKTELADFLKHQPGEFRSRIAPMLHAIDRVSSNFLQLRGTEDTLLRQSLLEKILAGDFDNVRTAYYQAMYKARHKLAAYVEEWRGWDNHKLLLVGGGSRVDPLKRHVCLNPKPGRQDEIVQTLDLELPSDLQWPSSKLPDKESFAFLTVAYGLSVLGGEIQESFTPDEIQVVTPKYSFREFPSHEELYPR